MSDVLVYVSFVLFWLAFVSLLLFSGAYFAVSREASPRVETLLFPAVWFFAAGVTAAMSFFLR